MLPAPAGSPFPSPCRGIPHFPLPAAATAHATGRSSGFLSSGTGRAPDIDTGKGASRLQWTAKGKHMSDLYGKFDFYGRLLDFNTLRARVIAHNVANLSTPGYRRREVPFDETLRQAVATGDSRVVRAHEPEIAETAGGTVKPDGNNVSFQEEYAEMVKNRVLFEMVNEVVKWRYKLNREAMRTR